jgi:hypothetical protein
MQVVDTERLRIELINKCGKSLACIRAVEYYIQLVRNPCYPPPIKLSYKVRKYLIELISTYGLQRCDIKQLVSERLKDTEFADLVDEVATVADVIRRQLNISSRVAAAVATYIVAYRRRRYISITQLVKIFNISGSSVSKKIIEASKILKQKQ